MENKMNLKVIISTFFLSILITSCATSGQSTMAGMGLGGALGAGVGAIADGGKKGQNRIRNVFIGATAGSLLGAGAGFLTDKAVKDGEKDAFLSGKNEGQKELHHSLGTTNDPVLLPPKVEARYIEDQVRGSVFVPAHVEYQIVEPARWSK